ncbi:MAG: hypothetical protein RLY95_8 [Pseudomonadota bacterium]|jgi:ABC-type transport system involved in cytochrome bd biosynthesis fused ATPase/permease subunit
MANNLRNQLSEALRDHVSRAWSQKPMHLVFSLVKFIDALLIVWLLTVQPLWAVAVIFIVFIIASLAICIYADAKDVPNPQEKSNV